MRRSFQKVQAAAGQIRRVEHPRLYRGVATPKSKHDWIDAAFKYGMFGWLMWLIWAPVLLGVLIFLIILI